MTTSTLTDSPRPAVATAVSGLTADAAGSAGVACAAGAPDAGVLSRLGAFYRAQSARRERRHDLLTIGGWSLVATSIALYLADGGITRFATLGGAVTAIGIITGLVATALMCLMLVLTARVPVIDRTLGQDRATTLHAQLGRGMVFGLLAHGAFLMAGYALEGKTTPVATFLDLCRTSTDFIWACVALLMFAVVGISSMVALRRKYPYEVWMGIHLTTYAAIVASLPHQFSMSGLFAEGTLARAFWIAMFLATAGVMLAFRVIAPIIATFTHRLTVSRVVPVGPDAVTIEMTGRNLDALEARGGHWLQWRFLTPALALQPHPFSLSADPTDSTLRITVRNLGAGSARLAALQPGTKVAVEGPYGMFTDASRTRERVVLVGAGIGIAPVRALLESTRFAPGDAAVILRASTPDELYLLDEVRALCATKGASLQVLVGPRAGASWVPRSYAGAHLTDLVPWATDADLYVCGPEAWMDAVLRNADECGIPALQIHDERFAW